MRKYFLILSAILFLSCTPKETDQDILPPQEEPAETPVGVAEEEPVPQEEVREPNAGDFTNYISLENCVITDKYLVPNVNNIILGLPDEWEPQELITENHLGFYWNGFQVLVKNDILPVDEYFLTAKNSKHSYTIPISLEPAYDWNDGDFILGFYQNVNFENKFWLSDGNDWQIILSSERGFLIDTYLDRGTIPSLFFFELDETPFAVNNLGTAILNRKYTFRCKNETELIVIYYSTDYEIYKPIFYLIPEKDNEQDYIDIFISWNDPVLRGQYRFVPYKIEDLPTEEWTGLIFDFVQIR